MNETELSSKLKNYFNKVEEVYGEDMAYATAASSLSIIDSLNFYSNGRFEDYDEEDICLELLTSELLCNKGENLMVIEANKLARKNPEAYMQTFESQPSFKAILLRSFVKNAAKSYNDRFERLDEVKQKEISDTIQKISSYQLARHQKMKKYSNEAKSLAKVTIIM